MHWEIIVLYCEKMLRVGIILLCDQKVVLWIETFCCALRIWATVDEHAIKTWEVISEVLELVPDEKGNVQAAASDCDINSPAHIFDNEITSSDTDDSDNDIIKKNVCLQIASSSDSDTYSE